MTSYSEPATAFSAQVHEDFAALVDEVSHDGLSPLREGRAPAQVLRAYQARLENHSICMVIPAGSVVDGGTMRLLGGILVLGALRGKVTCGTGSAIIGGGGEFQGQLEANDILVEGNITSPLDAAGKPVRTSLSDIRARGQKNAVTGEVSGGIILLSNMATVCARMRARAYQIPRNANVSGSVMDTLSENK